MFTTSLLAVSWIRLYAIRCPSGDHRALPRKEFVPASITLCAFSPSPNMTHTSPNPRPANFSAKTICEPLGETVHALPSSRICRGAPPITEKTQMPPLPLVGDASATNRVPSGNHEVTDHAVAVFFKASGTGSALSSPVSISFRCTPFISEYARYFPSGEIAAAITPFPLGLVVSWRSLSGPVTAGRCRENQ